MQTYKLLITLIISFSIIFAEAAEAAPIKDLRTSVSEGRVRFVLDSSEPIAYKVDRDGDTLKIKMPASSSKKMQPKVKDKFIKKVKLTPDGRNKSKLEITLAKDLQYKVYQLTNPHRLVIDVFRINIIKKTETIARGVKYTYIQDEINGRQLQAYLLSVDKNAPYELRPFSAAGTYNGRGLVSKAADKLDLPAAVNASYFDSDGWVIGTAKDNNNIFAADYTPRSGYVAGDKHKQIVKDLHYTGKLTLANNYVMYIKGMNRARINDDLVLYNEYYAPSTKTNEWGYEIKLKNNRVIAVSSKGNMSIEPGTMVISGHGKSAVALSYVRVGDKVKLEESVGNQQADASSIVLSGGPLLLEDGKINVRTAEENIAGDIAKGRAPRTAVGLKKDGTLLILVVDGRNKDSAGLTLTELAQYFLRLGARDAVNFDGGGSSVMVVKGKVVNKPSDGRERAVSIGAGLFPKY